MPLLGGITGFVDKYLLGYALGTAAGPALEPYAQNLANAGWTEHQVRPLDPVIMAAIAVEEPAYDGPARTWAARAGVDSGRFDRLKDLADEPPPVATLLTLWRRKLISPGAFNLGLQHLKIEEPYHAGLRGLKDARLTAADVANAIQQGFIPGDGYLPSDPGGSPPFTPGVDEVPINPTDEAEATGVPPDRLKVLAQLAGLPPGPQELLQMWNRGIITEVAVEHGIREGHTKTKWTSAIKELRHFLVSPQEAAGLRLRGWITRAEANRLGALRGATPEVMDLLYLNRGRPATTRQVHIGYARGGKLPGVANEREAFSTAVKNSNIRTEYDDLLWAQRHTYPSAFVIRALASDGTFPPALTEQILVESGWKPEWSQLAAAKWGATTATVASKWADRAASSLFTRARTEFLVYSIDDAQAAAVLTELGAKGPEAAVVLRRWKLERDVFRLELTPAQVKKAYKVGPPDGFDLATALGRLDELGMTPEDADTFLTT